MKKILLIIFAVTLLLNAQALFEVKDASDHSVFEITDDGIRIFNYPDTLMIISSAEIRANLDNSKDKALSRSFSISTTTTAKAGLANVLEVTTNATTMGAGSTGDRYADFSPENIFLGLRAGRNTTSSSNIFVGNSAGYNNTDGTGNTVLGNQAGYSNSSGDYNTYVGWLAGLHNEGNDNTFVGRFSGWGVYGGTGNVYLGRYAGKDNFSGDYNVCIGNDVAVGGSNKLAIDNMETYTPLIYGEFDNNLLVFNTDKTHLKHPVGNTTNGLFIQSTYNDNTDSWHFYQSTIDHLNLFYNTDLRGTWNLTTGVYTSTSDKKLKKNIEDFTNIMDRVMQLQPKKYNFKSQSDSEIKYIGLIAQDVKELFPSFVNYSEEDDTYTMDYAGLSVIAIQAIKELKDENDKLNSRLNEIEDLLKKLK